MAKVKCELNRVKFSFHFKDSEIKSTQYFRNTNISLILDLSLKNFPLYILENKF